MSENITKRMWGEVVRYTTECRL